ncbi:MAG: hypothetical protein JWR19_1988 [Pedosphaera sp.]|nr:hypothetical protein [Pedosphaera sp.]
MQLSAAEKKIVARVMKPDSSLGTLGRGMLVIWIMSSLFLACYAADHYLLLVWFYGFSRVFKDGLHFTYMPSSKSADDYVVSNGDHISTANAFIGFPMVLAVWVALILIGYLVIGRFSCWRKETHLRTVINDA